MSKLKLPENYKLRLISDDTRRCLKCGNYVEFSEVLLPKPKGLLNRIINLFKEEEPLRTFENCLSCDYQSYDITSSPF